MRPDDEEMEATQRDGAVFIQLPKRRPATTGDERRSFDLDERDLDFGEDADPELWGRQLPLIEEDEGDGLKLDGFDDEIIPRIVDAMGDEVAEPFMDAPNGASATGSVGGPDHGGFPERE